MGAQKRDNFIGYMFWMNSLWCRECFVKTPGISTKRVNTAPKKKIFGSLIDQKGRREAVESKIDACKNV